MRARRYLCAVFAAWLTASAVRTPVANAGSRSYSYDAAGRLTGEDRGGGQVVVYQYDASGNRIGTTMTGPNASPTADVAVVKTDSPDPVLSGSNITYTIVVTNNGPHPATGVKVIDTLPAVVASVSESFTQGSMDLISNLLTWSVGMLNSNASATLTLIIKPVITSTVTNTAVVSATPADPNTANNTSVVTTAVNAALDTDGDGMPDWWEEEHFGGPTNAVAGSDADGDGITDDGEYLADTNPHDNDSFLFIEDVTRVPAPVKIEWPTSPVRKYRIQTTEHLTGGTWSNLASGIQGDGGVQSVTDTNPPSSRHYRIGSELP
jgi:uncharacterized repeat protein (TIGR01451 family)